MRNTMRSRGRYSQHSGRRSGRRSGRPFVLRFVLRFAAVATGTVALLLVGALLLPSDDARCLPWKERPITYMDMTPSHLRALRAQTPVHEAPGLVSMGLFPGNFGGIALPDRVIISTRLGNHMTNAVKEHLIWHEIVHVEQMRRDGLGTFILLYAGDWVRGRLHGCGPFAAYEAIRYEREADLYAYAMELVDWTHRTGLTPALLDSDTTGSGSVRVGASRNPRPESIDTIPLRVIAEHLVGAGFP